MKQSTSFIIQAVLWFTISFVFACLASPDIGVGIWYMFMSIITAVVALMLLIITYGKIQIV